MHSKLTNKEYEIMKCIWDNSDGVTFNEICTYANLDKGNFKPQTINTHLCHLIEKGYVRAEGSGRKHSYYPEIPRAEYDNYLSNFIIEHMFNGSLKKFIAAFTMGRTLTEKEVSELKALIKMKKES